MPPLTFPVDVHWHDHHYGVPVDYEYWYDESERRMIFASNGAEIDSKMRHVVTRNRIADTIVGMLTRLGPRFSE